MKMRSLILVTAAIVMPAGLSAQDGANVEGRIVKLEKEMRAVQRQVFPGGDGRFFEPEIKPETSAPTPTQSESPSQSAVSGLITRVDAIEAQMARLTGQVEEQGNALRQLTARLDALEKANAAEPADVATAASAPAVQSAAVRPAARPSAAPAAATNARAQAVAAIERPNSGDAFDDSYSYGYRLWSAKFFPEAQQQLQQTVDSHGSHARASYARNLLGRAFLDDKKPASAAKIFYDNYKTDPRGARAPDSLYYLGMALTDLGKASDACGAYQQLVDAYPDVASGRLASDLAAGRTRAKCK